MASSPNKSVPRLFLTGILPGLRTTGCILIWAALRRKAAQFSRSNRRFRSPSGCVTVRALPALVVPVVVMVGIYGSIVTVTRAAALIVGRDRALVSLVFYRRPRLDEDAFALIADGIKSAATIA